MPRNYDGQVLRFFFATQHYRKPINFTEKAVRDAETTLKYLKNTYEQPFTGTVDALELQTFKDKFVAVKWMRISIQLMESLLSLNGQMDRNPVNYDGGC